ncbi:50S ribosomal protein L32 [Magnetococcales bacterium HHB-1]
MAVAKKKISKSRRGSRNAHNALKIQQLAVCPNCQEPCRPHHVCAKCGWYNGREVVEIED